MPHAGQLTQKDIAWCAGVEPARFRQWAASGRLTPDPPFTEYDALEAAVAFSLSRHGVSQKVATGAWDAVRPDVKRFLLAQAGDVWIIVSADGPEAKAVDNHREVAEIAAALGRCWVVRPADAVALARSRFATLRASLPGTPGEVRSLRSVRDGL